MNIYPPHFKADAVALYRSRPEATTRQVAAVPRITAQLREAGERVNHKRIARVMRDAGLSGVRLRRRHRTTVADPTAAKAPDLIGRDFTASEPNTRYVGDITYLPLHGGVREARLDAFRWLHRCNTRRRHSRRLACRSFVDRVAFGPPADFPPAASGCTGYGPTHARHSSPTAAGGPCLSHA
jgi:transposase InsO family protein